MSSVAASEHLHVCFAEIGLRIVFEAFAPPENSGYALHVFAKKNSIRAFCIREKTAELLDKFLNGETGNFLNRCA